MLKTLPYTASAERIQDTTLVILDGQSRRVMPVEIGSRRNWTMGRYEEGRPAPDIRLESKLVHRGLQGQFTFRQGRWYYRDDISVTNRVIHYHQNVMTVVSPNGEVELSHGDVLRIDAPAPASAHPDGVWILFSVVSIAGTWTGISLADRQSVYIGRDPGCEICQPLPYISRRHALVTQKDGQFFLSDCHSSDGTWLNGRRISATPELLREKDWFSICDCHFIFVNGNLFYNSRIPGISVSGTNRILLSADIESKKVPDRKGGMKELLRDVRVDIKEGTLTALLGVSGAGKSTLLNCLNGFDSSRVTGTVLFRGEDLYANFARLKRMVGSVPQENTFRDVQTVRTELFYDAVLRLPGDSTREEINRRVRETMQSLGLSGKERTEIHSLSGGEKKRVNIGVELVAERELLCLDEPDAGLDPLTKRELFQTLRTLAHNNGKTIIVIIHDVAEINLFDQVIMLLKDENGTGRLACSGSPEEVVKYFRSKSQTDPRTETDVTGMADAYELVTKNPDHYIWKDSSASGKVSAESGQKAEKVRSLPLLKEFRVSMRQFAGILFSDKANLFGSLLFPLAAVLMVVFVAGEKMYFNYENTKSACLLLVSAVIWCGLFNSIQIIVKDRAVIRLEYNAGRRLGCYVFSRGIVQMFLCAAQSGILLTAFPWIIHRFDNPIPEEGILFASVKWEYYISMFLLMLAADMMGLFISCLAKTPEQANTLAPYILIAQLVLSGALFALPDLFDRISLLMLSRWGMEALGSTSTLNDLSLRLQVEHPEIPLPARELEDMFLYEQAHLTWVWMILGAFSIVFLILGYMFLRRVAKDKR